MPMRAHQVSIPSDVHKRPWGGIPFIYSFGDSFQLAPVGMRAFYSQAREPKTGSWSLGMIAVADFRNPPKREVEECSVFVLDEVVRQTDQVFLDFLTRLRNGALQAMDVDFIVSRLLDNLPEEEQLTFKDAIHVVPRWKMAAQVTFKYLNEGFVTPIAVMQSHKESLKSSGNCFSNSTTLPTCSAVCIGAKVMLQANYIVELKLHNGSVGTVRDICYPNPDGPYTRYSDETEYVVVEFPESKLPVALVPGKPKTWIPIPVHKLRCDMNCCACTTIPLRLCNSISVHKSQGSTFGQGQVFEKAVCYLPNPTDTPAPGLEVVALSRCKSPMDMAIGNKKHAICGQRFLKTGQTKAYEERKAFHASLASQAETTRDRLESTIANLDPNPHHKVFERGCEVLLHWYRTRVGDGDAHRAEEDSSMTSADDYHLQDQDAQSDSSGLLRVPEGDGDSEDSSGSSGSDSYDPNRRCSSEESDGSEKVPA